MMTTVRMQRRTFLLGLGVSASAALLSACTGTVPPAGQKPAETKPGAAQPAAQQAPARTSGSGKVVTFWGRTQFLPESNA